MRQEPDDMGIFQVWSLYFTLKCKGKTENQERARRDGKTLLSL